MNLINTKHSSSRIVGLAVTAAWAVVAASCSREEPKGTATPAAPAAAPAPASMSKEFRAFLDAHVPVTKPCKSTTSAHDFHIKLKNIDATLSQAEVTHRDVGNGTSAKVPAPRLGSGHDTDADIDASPYLKEEGSVVKVTVDVSGAGVNFPTDRSIVIDKNDARTEMFCVGDPLDSQSDPTQRTFFVEHRKKGADNNIGSYFLIFESRGKIVEIKVDPNVKNTG